jgi:transcriptional regulator with XRE-family HTH domain
MNFKAMREQAGLTLEELAEKSGYSVSTINGLELNGEGSDRLKDKLREILAPRGADTALRETPPERESELWKRRAKDAESKLAQIRDDLRELLDKTSSAPVNSPGEKSAHRAANLGAEHIRKDRQHQ